MEQFGLPLQSALGVLLIPLFVWLICEDRRALGFAGAFGAFIVTLAVQYALVGLFLFLPWTQALFTALGNLVLVLQSAADAGAQLVFGYLAGAPTPFEAAQPQNGFILAFRILPMILLLSAIVRLLYHWGVLQRVVGALAWALQKTLGIGGPVSTAAASSVFLGMVEAPLMIRPYLAGMSRAALFATMCVGMATVAGTVLALYATVLGKAVPGAAGHLLVGSIINVPGALLLARLAIPKDFADGSAVAAMKLDDPPKSSVDAITQGTMEGVQIAVAVAATLLVMVALVALVNSALAVPGEVGGRTLTLQYLLGLVCMPLALIIGIPFDQAGTAGGLIGQKFVLNEFLAYLELAKTPAAELSERSRLILTYALCGFANLGSLGILIGGLSVMAPDRRAEIVSLAPKATLIGFLTTLLTASIIGTTVWS